MIPITITKIGLCGKSPSSLGIFMISGVIMHILLQDSFSELFLLAPIMVIISQWQRINSIPTLQLTKVNKDGILFQSQQTPLLI